MSVLSKFKERLRSLSVEELKTSYLNLSKDLFNIRNEFLVTHKIEKPHRVKSIKRDRARILTLLREKGETVS